MESQSKLRTASLLRVLIPLAATIIAREVSAPFVNGGIARMPGATQTLAGLGLAWGLIYLIANPLRLVSQASLVLTKNYASHRRLLLLVAVAGVILSGLVAALAATTFGVWVLEGLHGVDAALASRARLALLLLIPLPFVEIVVSYYSGILIKARRTEIITAGTVTHITCSIVAVFVLLQMEIVLIEPMLLPVAVTYTGWLTEALVIGWGYGRFGRQHVCGSEGEVVTFGYVLQFYYPLALVLTLQAASRPMINLFVSRSENGAESLAVLTIVFPLAHIFYGWINELRSLPAAFREFASTPAPIKRLATGCGLLSFSVMAIAFWSPACDFILRNLLGLSDALASGCRVPLGIFVFFPLVVTIRAYFHGVAVLNEQTGALTWSGPARIGIILVLLLLLPKFGLHGATLGVSALLSGFVLETVVVVIGSRAARAKR